jgi:hypothetical protein
MRPRALPGADHVRVATAIVAVIAGLGGAAAAAGVVTTAVSAGAAAGTAAATDAPPAVASGAVVPGAPSPTEARVKAAFVFNFARYASWPEDAFVDGDSPLVIGVLEPTAMADALEEALRYKHVHGRPVALRRFRDAREIDAPLHLLVLAGAGPRVTPGLPEFVMTAPVLTVGEAEGFCQRGGAVSFYLDDGHVRFEVNPDVIARQRLTMSSALLRLARIAHDEARPPAPPDEPAPNGRP